MSSGSVGYPDGQRVSQETLVDPVYQAVGTFTGNKLSGWLYGGNYASIITQVQVTQLTIQVQLNWALDSAGAVVLGGASFDLDNGVPNFTEWLHPMLAPYFRVLLAPSPPSGTFTANAQVFLSNQTRPRALTQPGAVTYYLNGNLAAGATSTVSPQSATSGSHGFYCHGGNQGVKVTIQALLVDNGGYNTCAVYTVAANADDYREIILPATACRVMVANTSGTTQNTGVIFIGSQDR